MTNLFLIVIAGASLAVIPPAAEKVVDFSGTWVLDPAHSESWNTDPYIRKFGISGGVSGGVVNDWPDGSARVDGNSPSEESLLQWMDLSMLIIQTDREMQTTRQFLVNGKEERTIVQKFTLDGSQCINIASDGRGEFVSRTRWNKDKLTNSGTQVMTTGKVRTEISVQEDYSLSQNGKRLTIRTRSVTPAGATTLKLVYSRQLKPTR